MTLRFGPELGRRFDQAVEPLPLFAAASARQAEPMPEIDEPAVALRPMKAGGEIVEDYVDADDLEGG